MPNVICSVVTFVMKLFFFQFLLLLLVILTGICQNVIKCSFWNTSNQVFFGTVCLIFKNLLSRLLFPLLGFFLDLRTVQSSK